MNTEYVYGIQKYIFDGGFELLLVSVGPTHNCSVGTIHGCRQVYPFLDHKIPFYLVSPVVLGKQDSLYTSTWRYSDHKLHKLSHARRLTI